MLEDLTKRLYEKALQWEMTAQLRKVTKNRGSFPDPEAVR